jgi:hypothetical protein
LWPTLIPPARIAAITGTVALITGTLVTPRPGTLVTA